MAPDDTTPSYKAVSGGAACGDFDRDGWLDLFVVRKDLRSVALYRNTQDGRFVDVARERGISGEMFEGSGPLFFDFDGDGWLDLFLGAVGSSHPVLYRNQQDGTFADVTRSSGLAVLGETISASAGDFDGDGRLDLFVTHWGAFHDGCHLWRNMDGRRFECADRSAGLVFESRRDFDVSFTGNFIDIDGDGRTDLLVTSDYGSSKVWLNRGDGTFADATTPVISDENGMGSTFGDIDGDGDFDWFVSSVFDGDGVTEGDWGASGNRLYRNIGGGKFEDATDAAGVREGDWGWGASFADYDNDGRLDLAHVNGWPKAPQFRGTSSRLFLGLENSRFEERSARLGFDDRYDGRGIISFDYDRDGDVDILTAGLGSPRLWRNEGGAASGNHLSIELTGVAPNHHAVGATIAVTAGGVTQYRAVRAGTNYVSQDPFIAHFGLGALESAERVVVTWPDGSVTTREDVGASVTIEATAPEKAEGCGG